MFAIVAIAAFAGLLIVVFGSLVLLAMVLSFPLIEEELARAASPDGKYVALIRSRDVNATTTVSQHVFLDYVDYFEPDGDDRIFVLFNVFPLELKWLDAKTLLISCSETVPRKEVHTQLMRFEEIEVRYTETLLPSTTTSAAQP